MAVPAYATDLSDITTSFSTGWSLVTEGGGGANSLTAPETDDFIQGTNAVSRNPFSSSIRGIVFDTGTAPTITTDDACFMWWKADVAQALDTLAGGGVHMCQGTGTTARRLFYIAGKDTYARGGWKCTPVDPYSTADRTVGSPAAHTGSNTDFFGCAWDVPATGPSKGFPFKIDMIRHGRSISVTAGEVANPATFDALTTYADDITRRWGIVQPTATGMEQQGIVNWGTGAALVYSRVSNKTLTLLDTLGFTSTDFTQIVFNHASSDVVWDNVTISSLDTLNKGLIEVNNNAAVSLTNCNIADIGVTTDGGTNSTWDGTAWRRCDAITAAGGDFLGCRILESSVGANASAFVWNIATNPNGIIDGTEFSKGALAHHAIEFGLTSPTAITLTDCTFTDFNASNAQNDSVLHFKRTTGTVTVTLDGTAQPSYRTDGATIVFVTGAVTVQVTAVTVTGTPVSGANVFLYATATTGTLPADDSVTIANSGTTATVTHTGHGLATNDYVVIKGASHAANNGAFQITVTGVNDYTYTMLSSPGSSPTGTIVSSFVFLYGTTNGSGVISMTRSIPANQSVAGHARKGTTAPYYKPAPIAGTVDSSTGAALTGVMTLDE